MKRALRAGVFFGLLSGSAAFMALLILAGSALRPLVAAAFPAGFLCGVLAFAVRSVRFPILGGMLSGALCLLMVPFATYLLALAGEGELPLRELPRVAFLMSVPLVWAFVTPLVVLGSVSGGFFTRLVLREEKP